MRTKVFSSKVIGFWIGLLQVGCGSSNDGPRPPGSGQDTWPPPGGTSSGTTGGSADGSDGGVTTDRLDTLQETGGQPNCNIDGGCSAPVDLVFVVDNSGTMGEEQLNLARNYGYLVEQLETLQVGGRARPLDVNMMVTTTDFGNPSCDAFREGGPEKGAPVDTPCTDRLDRFRFEALDPPLIKEDVCTESCTTGARPQDQFINFNTATGANNVMGGDPADALRCLGPQGVDGCGYEAPLESMLQALNAGACWNDPDGAGCDGTYERPFLRDDAVLAIVIITDEADCSVKDYSIMGDPAFWEPNPNGTGRATSAVCWNAGVVCDAPDANGVYPDCRSNPEDLLQPTSRYIDYLVGLRESQDKEVVMLGILGVPPVTAHAETAPFQPTAGGVMDLVYRDWRDGVFPNGDILPDDAAAGMDAASKQFEFAIGPGCTGEDPAGGFTGQAIAPVRVKEVCQALDYTDDDGEEQIRCCIESICDTDFSAAINCLAGIISGVVPPAG